MSFEADNFFEVVSRRFHEMAAIKRVDDGLRITTHCMYPSNGFVQVTVRSGIETVVASDEGGAMGEALSAGIPVFDAGRQLAHVVKDQGLLMKEGVIYTPRMPIEAAPLAIAMVANASQEAARWLYENTKIKRTRDFKVMLAAFLKIAFEDRVAPATIVGHSHKPHKFANVVSFANGKKLIVDPVVHDANSINGRLVANLDVKSMNNPLIDQRIVYDDEEVWTAADLNLLQVGATAIPFSQSSEVIARIAAHA